MVEKTCLAVNEDGASCVPFLGFLFSESGRETARQSRHILVEMNDVAGIDRGVVQVAFACVKNLRRRCGRSTSLAQTASSAFRLRSRGCLGVLRLN
jgi:hypothetical protein